MDIDMSNSLGGGGLGLSLARGLGVIAIRPALRDQLDLWAYNPAFRLLSNK